MTATMTDKAALDMVRWLIGGDGRRAIPPECTMKQAYDHLASRLAQSNDLLGYQEAFFEMTGIMGVGPKEDSPADVYERVIKPMLIGLVQRNNRGEQEGWKSISVTEGYGGLMDALDRSAESGTLPDDVQKHWEEFDFKPSAFDNASAIGPWRTMDSAPKDCSDFICWVSATRYREHDDGRVEEVDCSTWDSGWWVPSKGCFVNEQGYIGDNQEITHWMPHLKRPEAQP